MTVIAVKCLITPCQVKGVFIFMSWGCVGNGATTHYLLKGWWQTMYLRKSEKWKIAFLSLNKPVLSNIYDTERKQGQKRTFIDIMIGGDCHRTWAWESTKEKSGIVFGGSAYQWNQGLLRSATGLVSCVKAMTVYTYIEQFICHAAKRPMQIAPKWCYVQRYNVPFNYYAV